MVCAFSEELDTCEVQEMSEWFRVVPSKRESSFIKNSRLASLIFLLFPDVKRAFDDMGFHFNKKAGRQTLSRLKNQRLN